MFHISTESENVANTICTPFVAYMNIQACTVLTPIEYCYGGES